MDLKSWAKTQIGTKEFPPASNNVKYNTAFYGHPVHDDDSHKFPWCCTFVYAACKACVIPFPAVASCTSAMLWAKKQGCFVDKNFKPNDIVFFRFKPGTSVQHIGICESVKPDKLVTIEGNTGIGDDTNGGEVMRRDRPLSLIAGAYRPKIENKKGSENMYTTLIDIPDGEMRTAVKNWMDKGIIKGVGKDGIINLSSDMIRMIVFIQRAEKTK